MNPKISIITITYNSQQYVREAVQSVISQGYDNLEYIIIDGGSQDQTLTILDQYRTSIDLLISEPDKGISDAFNKGIARCTGDVIGIVNSDDYLLPGALQAIADAYEEDVDIYRSNDIIWNVQTGNKFREIPSLTFPLMPLNLNVAHQGTFVSATCYSRYGVYDLSLRFCMDRDFLLRCYRRGAKFKYVNYDTAVYRWAEGATTQSMFSKRTDYIRLITNNGGNLFQAYLYFIYMLLRDVAKRILNLFGSDVKRLFRYKAAG